MRGREKESHAPNNAVSSLAELLGDGIALVDDEVLVEDLENLASLQVTHDCGFLDRLVKLCWSFQRLEMLLGRMVSRIEGYLLRVNRGKGGEASKECDAMRQLRNRQGSESCEEKNGPSDRAESTREVGGGDQAGGII